MTCTILIVDDEPTQRRLTHYIVEERLGYRAHLAGGGQEAIDHILSGREPRPDAVLLDLMMPEVGGMEVIRAIRPARPLLPIIVLTAHGDMEKAAQAVKAGANDFLTKPAAVERIGVSLENALRLSLMSREIFRLRRGEIPRIAGYTSDPAQDVAGALPLVDDTGNLRSMAELEAKIIEFALTYYEGHMSKIARDLAIGRSTLYRKLHDLNIPNTRASA